MVGEMSAFHTFDSDGVESDDEGDATSIMTTNEAPKNDLAASKLSDGWLPSIMKTHKVKADRRNFDISISLFFELAHTYHPLVHPPWVRQTHEELWQESFHRSDSGFARNVAKRLSVGMIFLCLAVGACQEPSRMNPEAECRTTGYSLYAVAMELLQPFLDLTQDQPPTMQSLQALGLNVRLKYFALHLPYKRVKKTHAKVSVGSVSYQNRRYWQSGKDFGPGCIRCSHPWPATPFNV